MTSSSFFSFPRRKTEPAEGSAGAAPPAPLDSGARPAALPYHAAHSATQPLRALLGELSHHDSLLWRRAIRAGVAHGPDALVRFGPPVFGLVVGALLKQHRETVRRNLRLVLGPRPATDEWADVARVFANYANCLAEAFVAASDRGDKLVAHHVNDANYLGAVELGRGVIVATAHTGGWQAAGPLLSSVHEADVLVVMRRERDERAQALQDDARDRAGIRVAHVGDDPLDALPLLTHLKRRGVLAVQMDRLPVGMRCREATLFGRPWLVPEGPLLLSALSGAPIVPVFTRRLSYMHYEVEAARPIFLPRRPTASELDRTAQQLMDQMATFIRNNPTQWFHFE
jgi:KDO2-lipid IV(A) lauroyltransferase